MGQRASQRLGQDISRVITLGAMLLLPSASSARYVAITLGGQVGCSINAADAATGAGVQTEFDAAKIVGVDFGWMMSRWAGGVIHYSHAAPDLELRHGAAIGSSADLSFGTHTLTLDGRIHSPTFARFRVYGFFGAGVARFRPSVREQVEVPFPDGTPDSVFKSVLTYGAGIERIIFPYLRWRVEVRNDRSRLPDGLLPEERTWNRTQAVVGLVIGR